MARAPSFHNEQHERSAEIRLDERIDNKRVPCQRPDTEIISTASQVNWMPMPIIKAERIE